MQRTPEQIKNELLVIQAQAGDRGALRELVETWQPRLLRHATCVTKHRDVADEVVQEAWIAIVRGLRRLQDPSAFKAWAFRIVQNRSIDWIRREAKRRGVQAELALEPNEESSSQAEIQDQRVQSLRSGISRLKEELRIPLHLLYSDGMSVREIATTLDLPEGTVKHRLYRARQELKTYITSEGEKQ